MGYPLKKLKNPAASHILSPIACLEGRLPFITKTEGQDFDSSAS
jgi:hypothetical protein